MEFLTKLISGGQSLLSAHWKIAAGIAAAIMLYFAASSWYNNQIDTAYEEGRVYAVEQCNTVQLEEDLAQERLNVENAEKRHSDVLESLQEQRIENAEQDVFIAGMQGRLAGFQDGELSERTIQFMQILSERSAQYYDQSTED